MNDSVSKGCGCAAAHDAPAATRGVADADRVVYRIENMDCPTEVALIRRKLERLPGVVDLDFDWPQRTLALLHTLPSTAPVEAALAGLGMTATRVTSAPLQTTVLRIDQMDCPTEEGLIRRALAQIPDVVDCHFDLTRRTLTLSHPSESLASIVTALHSIGFEVDVQSEPKAPPPTVKAPQAALQQRTPSASKADRVVFRIENMDCPTEEALIREKLGQVPGVSNLEFNLVQRKLTVEHSLSSLESVEEALRAIGMKALREKSSAEIQTVLRIEKMDCPTEERLIRDKLSNMPGVVDLNFNLLQRTLTVTHAPKALDGVVAALRSLGLEAQTDQQVSADGRAAARAERPKTNWWPMLVSGVAAISAEVVYWLNGGLHWAVVALALVAIFTGGLPTYKKGWIALRNRNLNMNALMSIAVTGAMLIGQWPEAAMVMFLFALAELIEAKSLDRARNAVRKLMDLAPETATMRQPNGSWVEVAAATVPVDAVVRVKPGERIALDGQVISGRSTVNQAPITGESMPVDKAEGDAVFAATINEAGSMHPMDAKARNDGRGSVAASVRCSRACCVQRRACEVQWRRYHRRQLRKGLRANRPPRAGAHAGGLPRQSRRDVFRLYSVSRRLSHNARRHGEGEAKARRKGRAAQTTARRPP